MMHIQRVLLAAAMVLLPAAGMAQSQFKADDVINHFTPADEAAVDCPAGSVCLPKKKTRAVCIGTDSACAAEQVAAKPAAEQGGFDLLITFELGSDRLSDQAQANLREFAEAMTNPALAATQFNVDGHTDARGSDTFNNALSQRRAAAVVDFLKALGVSEDRLVARGHGESQPRTDDPFAAINRRVEATIRTQ